MTATFWQSQEAMHGGEEASHWFRAFGAEVAGGEVTGVERYEVVFWETESTALVGALGRGSL
jgi:hypothetical protein